MSVSGPTVRETRRVVSGIDMRCTARFVRYVDRKAIPQSLLFVPCRTTGVAVGPKTAPPQAALDAPLTGCVA